jgi:hypothetical protein
MLSLRLLVFLISYRVDTNVFSCTNLHVDMCLVVDKHYHQLSYTHT